MKINIEYYDDVCFVDWNKKRVIRNGLAKGTYYACYIKLPGEKQMFAHWSKRKWINDRQKEKAVTA